MSKWINGQNAGFKGMSDGCRDGCREVLMLDVRWKVKEVN